MQPGRSSELPDLDSAQVQVWGDPDEVQKEPTPERLAYVHRMRKRFTHSCLLTPELNINQEMFAPKACLTAKPRVWGAEEQALLLKGIELYGVGKWREISNHLPDWNDNELRSRTGKLLGSQSLAPYIGWRGRKEHVLAEHKRNQRVGKALKGCWRTGTLIEDDAGQLEAYFQKHPADRRPGPGLKAHAVPGVRDHLTPLSEPAVIAQQADAAMKDAEANVLPTEAADGTSSPKGTAKHQPQKPLRDCSGRSNVPADPAQTAAGKQALGFKSRSVNNNTARRTSKQLDCS